MASASASVSDFPRADALPVSFLTAESVGRVCGEASERIQLTAEILILQSGSKQPAVLTVNTQETESYGKSRDAIVANTKGLAISIKDLGRQLNQRNLAAVYRNVEHLTDQVVALTESAAHAAYFASLTDINCTPASPSVVDRYLFAKAKQAIHMAYNKFRLEHGPLNREQILHISRTIAKNLVALVEGCKLASADMRIGEIDRSQFSSCVQCLQATTSVFLSSLTTFASHNTDAYRKRCLLFGDPLLKAVDCIVEFANLPQFAGTPAQLTQRGYKKQTEILGAAMAIVSASIQLLATSKAVLMEASSPALWQKMSHCSKAVADATKLLSSSIREHTPASSRNTSRRPSTDV